MMRFSRVGIIALLAVSVLAGANCGYYNRVMARKDLVDGSAAYKNRKFDEAEALFKKAIERDPKGDQLEGRMALLFYARTLHSQYIGKRDDKAKAEAAIEAYKASLPSIMKEYQEAKAAYEKEPGNKAARSRYRNSIADVGGTTSAIAGLYDNLQMTDQATQWRQQISKDAQYPETARASAFNSIAARANSCASDITDTEQTKKKVTEGGKEVYQYVKPANPEDLTKLKTCIDEGMAAADQALALEPSIVKNLQASSVGSMTDDELLLYREFVKPFESSRSYKAAMLVQSMRLAEMEGRTEDKDRLKTEAEAMRQSYLKLGDVSKDIQAEIDKRIAEKAAEAGGNRSGAANANSAGNK
jgi:tetratricopeptide (TPR) repeat protein